MSLDVQRKIHNEKIKVLGNKFSYTEEYSLKLFNDINSVTHFGYGSGKYLNYIIPKYNISYSKSYNISSNCIMISDVLEHVSVERRKKFLIQVSKLIGKE